MRGLLALRPAGYKEVDCSNRAAACTSGDILRFHIYLNGCRLCGSGCKRTVMGITVGWRIGPSPKFRTAPRERFPVTFCLGFVRRFMQAARAETVTRFAPTKGSR